MSKYVKIEEMKKDIQNMSDHEIAKVLTDELIKSLTSSKQKTVPSREDMIKQLETRILVTVITSYNPETKEFDLNLSEDNLDNLH